MKTAFDTFTLDKRDSFRIKVKLKLLIDTFSLLQNWSISETSNISINEDDLQIGSYVFPQASSLLCTFR